MTIKDDKKKYQAQLVHIGKKIAYYREKKGWSKQALSDYANVDRATLTYIEDDEGINITIITLCKIADALGVKLRDLMP